MPDGATRVETNHQSGEMKVILPVRSPHGPDTDTRLEIDTNSAESAVIVKDVPHTEGMESVMPESTSGSPSPPYAAPVSVQVQHPNAGGLSGPWATVANLSAVGVVIIFLFWVYRDSQANMREFFGQMREDRVQDRADNKASDLAMVAALGTLSAKMDSIAVSNQALANSNNAMIAEMQRARQDMAALMKLLTKDKLPEDDK